LKKLEFLGFLPVNPGLDEEPKHQLRVRSISLHVARGVPEDVRRHLEEVTRRMNERVAGKGGDDGPGE
jgi:hypothetical protein